MVASDKPLFAKTANDLMSRKLVLLAQQMSLKGAAHLLWQAQVSGAPVVDENGRCIGVLSSMEFLHMVEQGKQTADDSCREAAFTSSQIMKEEEHSSCLVCEVMNRDPVTVSPNANIGELSRMMRDAHEHRVIVCDEEGRPLGLVTAMDILSAVAQQYQAEQFQQESAPHQSMVDELFDLVR